MEAEKVKESGTSREEMLKLALAAANKQFGKNSIFVYNKAEVEPVQVIKTGSLLLDRALGVSGYPVGRIVEVFGMESSGKTTLALHAIAECQKNGGTCMFVDAEHALDIKYAESLGVNIDKLILAQPTTGEEALGLVDHMVKSGTVDLIVIDSVAALTPQAELEGEIGDQHVGRQARLMSQTLRMINAAVSRNKILVIFINQIRDKVNTMGYGGNPEVTPGGKALKFYASVRLDIRRTGSTKDGDEITGNQVMIKVVKNKVAAPFKTVDTTIVFGHGIDRIRELLALGLEADVIKRTGAWYITTLDEDKIIKSQGYDQFKEYFESNEDDLVALEALV